jgi:hypothetical protein
MLGKDDLISAMHLECDVAKHIFSRLPREDWRATLDYRPSPPQRSTLELLRYLSYTGITGCLACLGQRERIKDLEAAAASLAAEEFPAAMDREKEEIARLLGSLTDEDLAARRVKNPLGEEMTLGRALLDMPVRWLTGYRMQFFLYARALGAEVVTPDCWYGVSMPRPAPPAQAASG